MKSGSWFKLIPIFILLLCLAAFFYFHLYEYVSFHSLKSHRVFLLNYVKNHFALAMMIFIFSYIILVAISAPGVVLLTLAGGFLFGPVLGTILVVLGATIGATIIFYAAKTALHDFLYGISQKWFSKLAKGFEANAVSYLLFLRLVPLFPFGLVNIVPAFFGVRIYTFVLTTFFGIIPGTFVYIMIGNGLGLVLEHDQIPNLNIIFQPAILIPIIGLAILALLPIIYKVLRRHKLIRI